MSSSHTANQSPGGNRAGKIPARRKVLRVLRGTTKAPNIRGKEVSPKRRPEDFRRFREAKNEPKQDLHALFGQFVEFMSKAIDQYGDADQSKDSGNKKNQKLRIYTPLPDDSKIPDIKAEPPSYKPEVTKGKLYFNCPACLYPTAVFAEFTGKKTRCPRCFSAILTPNPETGAAGQNLENDIETLLHPEEFIAPLPRRSSIQTVLPLPQLNTALSTAAMIVFFAASIGAGHLAVKHYSPNKPVVAESDPSRESVENNSTSVEILQARAEALVERFLNEPDWYSRSRLVRDRLRVAPLMKDYYQTLRPNDIPGQYDREIKAGRTGYYAHLGADIQYTVVSARPSGSTAPPTEYIVEHHAEGDVIEWETSVAYNPEPLDKLLMRKPGEIETVRVLAYQDDYFNYGFNNDREFICLRIQFPDNPEKVAYSYLPVSDIETPRLLKHLRGASRDNPKPMMLDVRITEHAATSRQLEIVGVGESHWRWNGDINPAFLVNGDLPLSPAD